MTTNKNRQKRNDGVTPTLAELTAWYRSTRDRLDRSRRSFEADQGALAHAEETLAKAMLAADASCVLDGDWIVRVTRVPHLDGRFTPKVECFETRPVTAVFIPADAVVDCDAHNRPY
jgi:hypothetical protein